MKRILVLLALACVGWAANNPSGDIQAFGGSGGGGSSTDPNAVHQTGTDTISGVKTFTVSPIVPDASFAESATVNLVSDLASKATDSLTCHLAGTETITGAKTFSIAPVVPSASFPESAVTNLTTDLAAKATDSLVLHLAGTETVSGAKTFSADIAANGNIVLAAAKNLQWSGRAWLSSPVDGQLFIQKSAGGGAASVLLGSATSGLGVNLTHSLATLLVQDGAGNYKNIFAKGYLDSQSNGLDLLNGNANVLFRSGGGVVGGVIDANQNWTLNGNVTAAANGTFFAGNGNATHPSVSLTNLPNAGMYTDGTNLLFAQNGTLRLTLGGQATFAGSVAVSGNLSASGQIAATASRGASSPGIATSNSGTTGFYNNGANGNLLGFATAGLDAGSIDPNQNWAIGNNANNYMTLDGNIRLTANNTAGISTITITDSLGSPNTGRLVIGGTAGNTAIALGSSEADVGELVVSRATGDAFRLTTAVNGRLSSDSQFGWSSGNGANTARDVSLYRTTTGILGVNNGSGTTPNGYILQGTRTVPKTGSYTVLAADNGSVFTNEAATGTVPFTLPACTNGTTVGFYDVAAFSVTVTAAGSDTIVVPGLTQVTKTVLTSPAVGSGGIRLFCPTTTSPGVWQPLASQTGVWTSN